MRVGDICNHHAVIIGKTDSIFSAAVLMRDQHVNYIVVVESSGGRNIPVGSITDRDIVVKMVANSVDLHSVTIGEAMNASLLLADEHDSVVSTLKRMRHKGLRHIPVINPCRALIGILSIDDILDRLAEQLNDIGYIIAQEQLSLQEDIFEKH